MEAVRLRGEISKELTPREVDIMRLTAEGCLNSEIATTLVITRQTVQNHKKTIFDKLEARTGAQAVAILKDRGLLEKNGD